MNFQYLLDWVPRDNEFFLPHPTIDALSFHKGISKEFPYDFANVRDRAPDPLFYRMLGQTHVNGWSRVIASQNGGSTSYIFPFRLRVLQWSRHLFNYLDK